MCPNQSFSVTNTFKCSYQLKYKTTKIKHITPTITSCIPNPNVKAFIFCLLIHFLPCHVIFNIKKCSIRPTQMGVMEAIVIQIESKPYTYTNMRI